MRKTALRNGRVVSEKQLPADCSESLQEREPAGAPKGVAESIYPVV